MKPSLLILATSLSLLFSATQAGPVAKVNGKEISESMFTAFATSRIQKPVGELTEAERELINEELIKLVVIGSEARKKKVQSDPLVAAQLELQQLSLLAQTYLQKHLQANPVSNDNLQALYESKYGSQPLAEYKARHILVTSPTAAQNIIGELDAGANFAELAAKHSTGPSANSGGDLGWFTRQQMVAEFADAVANMNNGSHSTSPVQTQYGWHVILKEAEREAPPPALAEVGQELQRELQQKEIETLVNGLRDAAKVKTYQ